MKPKSKGLPATLVANLLLIFLLIGIPSPALAQEDPSPPQQRSRRVNDAPQQPDDETLRVETNLVDVLFNALDKDHRFITTLRQEDIRVFENNVPQEISVFQRETDLPLSLAILIDTSESQKEVLPDEKDAALAFIESVIHPEKDRVAILSFTGETILEQELINDPTKLRRAIERVQFELSPENIARVKANEPPLPVEQDPTGYTGVWDALWLTVNEVLSHTPEHTRRAIILLSDGDDTSSKVKKQEAIDLAVKANVVIYSIGIRDENFPYGKLDVGALRKVSEGTGGRVFLPKDETQLSAAFAQIQQELRSQYLVAYSPSNKARDGSYRQVRIEVINPELRKQKLKLTYRQGYYALPAAHVTGQPNVPPDGEVRHLRVPRNKK